MRVRRWFATWATRTRACGRSWAPASSSSPGSPSGSRSSGAPRSGEHSRRSSVTPRQRVVDTRGSDRWPIHITGKSRKTVVRATPCPPLRRIRSRIAIDERNPPRCVVTRCEPRCPNRRLPQSPCPLHPRATALFARGWALSETAAKQSILDDGGLTIRSGGWGLHPSPRRPMTSPTPGALIGR